MDLTDATVLVTGATGGIGRAAALRLHARGAKLVVHGRDAERLARVADEVGGRPVPGDLCEPDGPEEIARLAGQVDAVVHCAGVGLRGALTGSAPAQLDRVVALNLRAPVQLTRALLPAMRDAGRGHLAYVASIAGLAGVGREAVYAATKAGLLGFAESLRLELAGSGVTVSTVSPGAVDTGFWAARGAAYHRSTPRPVPAGQVADVLVHDIARGRGDRVVPRWLGVVPAVRALAPRLYGTLAARMDG